MKVTKVDVKVGRWNFSGTAEREATWRFWRCAMSSKLENRAEPNFWQPFPWNSYILMKNKALVGISNAGRRRWHLCWIFLFQNCRTKIATILRFWWLPSWLYQVLWSSLVSWSLYLGIAARVFALDRRCSDVGCPSIRFLQVSSCLLGSSLLLPSSVLLGCQLLLPSSWRFLELSAIVEVLL